MISLTIFAKRRLQLPSITGTKQVYLLYQNSSCMFWKWPWQALDATWLNKLVFNLQDVFIPCPTSKAVLAAIFLNEQQVQLTLINCWYDKFKSDLGFLLVLLLLISAVYMVQQSLYLTIVLGQLTIYVKPWIYVV